MTTYQAPIKRDALPPRLRDHDLNCRVIIALLEAGVPLDGLKQVKRNWRAWYGVAQTFQQIGGQ